MVSIHSKRINVNGLDIHYFTGGQGEPLVIVHGGGEGARAWKRNIVKLSKQYQIFVPDLPGFGSSQDMDTPYAIPKIVDFVDNFVNSIGLKSFYLMGHSFGGGVAAHYALKYPEKIRKLVLVSSLCMGREIAWWVRWFSNPMILRIVGKAAVSLFKGVKYVAGRLSPTWDFVEPVTKTSVQLASCIATFKEQAKILLNQLPQILVPTLVMWGARDAIVPAYQAYTAAELIPNCQVRVFENCGHSVYRDRLHEFSRELTRFLG